MLAGVSDGPGRFCRRVLCGLAATPEELRCVQGEKAPNRAGRPEGYPLKVCK
jgi:hypothetical protein